MKSLSMPTPRPRKAATLTPRPNTSCTQAQQDSILGKRKRDQSDDENQPPLKKRKLWLDTIEKHRKETEKIEEFIGSQQYLYPENLQKIQKDYGSVENLQNQVEQMKQYRKKLIPQILGNLPEYSNND